MTKLLLLSTRSFSLIGQLFYHCHWHVKIYSVSTLHVRYIESEPGLFVLLQRRTMEPPKPSNPLLSFSTFIHQHCLRLGAELASRLDDTRRLAGNWPPPALRRSLPLSSLPFASMSQEARGAKRDLGVALSSDHVAKSLAGTAVYTVSNSNNEFVLISDPNGIKSIGLLCFRQEDAEAFLAQVCLFLFLPFFSLCIISVQSNGKRKRNFSGFPSPDR